MIDFYPQFLFLIRVIEFFLFAWAFILIVFFSFTWPGWLYIILGILSDRFRRK